KLLQVGHALEVRQAGIGNIAAGENEPGHLHQSAAMSQARVRRLDLIQVQNLDISVLLEARQSLACDLRMTDVEVAEQLRAAQMSQAGIHYLGPGQIQSVEIREPFQGGDAGVRDRAVAKGQCGQLGQVLQVCQSVVTKFWIIKIKDFELL